MVKMSRRQKDPPPDDTSPSRGVGSGMSSQAPLHQQRLIPHQPGPIRATVEMCIYCYDTILAHLVPSSGSGGSTENTAGGTACAAYAYSTAASNFLRSIPITAECPIFVTWDKARRPTPPSSRAASWLSGGGSNHAASGSSSGTSTPANSDEQDSRQEEDADFELRGCIGTLAPRPLRTAIGEFALTSAFRDGRFNPIAKHELPHLRVAVSLLVNYEECSHVHDWVIGVHGIIIAFRYGSADYSATYLPEVAQEQGWNQEEAVLCLIRKSGFYGEICSNLLCRVQCTRYQSSKRRLTWSDYVMLQGRDPLEDLSHDNVQERNSGAVASSPGGGGGRPNRCPFFPW
uniref:AMMECR1 domain-containing protein n=1 Tax=Minutocellus polymorphus TaxID=265543 RepID=A0A7S0AYP0_9STRA|mmetsp:Transcript_7265/g.12061  ORF Transcript_7265/g.12061 Transcript_7265/m.12061 type:complete len:345 (+) Transcript_7265:52-1086(+)